MNSKTAKHVYEQIVSTKILDSEIRKNPSVKKHLLIAIKNIPVPLKYQQPKDVSLTNDVIAITYIKYFCNSVVESLKFPDITFDNNLVTSESIIDTKDVIENIDVHAYLLTLKQISNY